MKNVKMSKLISSKKIPKSKSYKINIHVIMNVDKVNRNKPNDKNKYRIIKRNKFILISLFYFFKQ